MPSGPKTRTESGSREIASLKTRSTEDGGAVSTASAAGVLPSSIAWAEAGGPMSRSSATTNVAASAGRADRPSRRTPADTAEGSASTGSPSYDVESASRDCLPLTRTSLPKGPGGSLGLAGTRRRPGAATAAVDRFAADERTDMTQHPTTLRTASRLALGTLAAACTAGLVLVAAPGWAHVTVNPGTATRVGTPP